MVYETLLVEKQEGVGVITLNRPERLNAISRTLKIEIDKALTVFERDEEVKAVVFTGVGDKAFSAGADIHEMSRQQEVQSEEKSGQPVDWIWHLAAFKKPTIGAINGLAYGGGALIASLFDIRLAANSPVFVFWALSTAGLTLPGPFLSSWVCPWPRNSCSAGG